MTASARCKPPSPLEGGLYLVSTPIGNAADITLRSLDVLARADVLACEDTRSLRRLLAIHGVPLAGRRLVAYHDRSPPGALARLGSRLKEGASVAYAPEAGTALISDPGYRLVERAVALGVEVFPVPGSSALLAALTASALPPDRFLFCGFPPSREAARRRLMKQLTAIPATIVFFESPHRLAASLNDMAEAFGPRPAAIARELTKAFGEIERGNLEELANDAAGKTARGEHTVVVGPPAVGEPSRAGKPTERRPEQSRTRSVAQELARVAGISSSDAYRIVLAAKQKKEPRD